MNSQRVTQDATDVLRFDGSPEEWDAFVAATGGSSFCHLAGWREVMAEVLGHEPIYLVARDASGSWRGVLPLVRVHSRLFGHYLVSMPFLSYGGPLGSEAARTRLVESAVSEARRSGADLLELRTRTPLPGLRRSERKVTVVLPLAESVDEQWRDRLAGKVRSQIRRPQKAGMEARIGGELAGPFYHVFSRHMRDLGTPVLPRSFFEEIQWRFAEQVVFGVVYSGREPIAAGCGFLWDGEFEITWASALLRYKRAAPNMLLYWSFIEEMILRGVSRFNFGRCTPGGGTHRFKLQWGGKDVPLPWAQWSARSVTATPSPDRPLYQTAAALWRRLPLAIANRLGPPLARNLP